MLSLIRFFLSYAFLLLLFCSGNCKAQNVIKGKILDNEGLPVQFASIYLKETYEGTSSDLNGNFQLTTKESGNKTLVVSCISYQKYEKTIILDNKEITIKIQLEPIVQKIKEIFVNASVFEASDEKSTTPLKPLDIVTIAGSGADISKAYQVFSGVQKVGEQEGLFVRGGSAEETKTVIDHMVVQNPYFTSIPDIPQSGRFQSFLFKGMVFSTGGYSALYGQALSSVLLLNTVDLADTSGLNLGLSLAGASISKTTRKPNTSLVVSCDYSNLKPFFLVNNEKTEWIKVPNGINGNIVFHNKFKNNGMLKVNGLFSTQNLSFLYPNPENPVEKYKYSLDNKNLFLQASYNGLVKKNFGLYIGSAFCNNIDKISLDAAPINQKQTLTQGKIILTNYFQKFNLRYGFEGQKRYTKGYNYFRSSVNENYYALYSEVDAKLFGRTAARIGLRAESSNYVGKTRLSPRVTISHSLSRYSSLSFASGYFCQVVEDSLIHRNLDFEKALHFILNYQLFKNNRTFRLEVYRKNYLDLALIKNGSNIPEYNNSGEGYANGIDIFWIDKKTIPDLEYWLSYSYIDTKRQSRYMPQKLKPSYVSDHNAALILKYWINSTTTAIGLTQRYASGRSYYFIGQDGILSSEETPDYYDLSFSISNLGRIYGKLFLIYLSIDNVLNRANIFGFKYSSSGTKTMEVGPPSLRTFFVGFFIEI